MRKRLRPRRVHLSLGVERLEDRRLLTTLTLDAARDNSLFQDEDGAFSNGSGEYLFVGRSAQPVVSEQIRRALVLFDFAGQIPAGATIDSVSLTLNMSKTIAEEEPVTLHRMLALWDEGVSDASGQEGTGTAAADGDATWLHGRFPDENWDTPGGDFLETHSGAISVGGLGAYTWSTPEMVEDVVFWLENPDQNFGWILLGNEDADTTAKRFDSRENANAANRPMLAIEFTEAVITPTASIADASLSEGDDGNTTLAIPVTISNPPSAPVTIDFTASAGTATAETDFIPVSGTLTYTNQGPLTQEITIDIVGDRLLEADETITVALSNAVGVELEDAQATFTILNDDPLPEITIVDISVTEGDAGSSQAEIFVQLSAAAELEVAVDYATQDAVALAGQDFFAHTGTLTFPAKQTTRTIEIDIRGDTAVEGNETFAVTLSSPTNAVLTAKTTSIVTILNDDQEGGNQRPWHHADLPQDTTGDGVVVPRDALVVINRINDFGSGPLPAPTNEDGPPPFYDVNGDGEVTPNDVLRVINFVNARAAAQQAATLADLALALSDDEAE